MFVYDQVAGTHDLLSIALPLTSYQDTPQTQISKKWKTLVMERDTNSNRSKVVGQYPWDLWWHGE